MNSVVDIDVTDLREQVEQCRESVNLPEQGNGPWSEVPLELKLRVLLIERLQQLGEKRRARAMMHHWPSLRIVQRELKGVPTNAR